MVCLGFEPTAAELWMQTEPLSHSDRPILLFKIMLKRTKINEKEAGHRPFKTKQKA